MENPVFDAQINNLIKQFHSLENRKMKLFINRELKKMSEIYYSKDTDYANGKPLANLRACEEFNVPAWIGSIIRTSDKKKRFETFLSKQIYAVKKEKVDDTLRDFCNYIILTSILFDEFIKEHNLTEQEHQQVFKEFNNISHSILILLWKLLHQEDFTTEWRYIDTAWKGIASYISQNIGLWKLN